MGVPLQVVVTKTDYLSEKQTRLVKMRLVHQLHPHVLASEVCVLENYHPYKTSDEGLRLAAEEEALAAGYAHGYIYSDEHESADGSDGSDGSGGGSGIGSNSGGGSSGGSSSGGSSSGGGSGSGSGGVRGGGVRRQLSIRPPLTPCNVGLGVRVSGLQRNSVNFRSIRLLTCAYCHFLHLDPIRHDISVGSYLPISVDHDISVGSCLP
jgi:hypothetical protein